MRCVHLAIGDCLMICKPDETEFRDSGVVTALRESSKVAVHGGKGVWRGIRTISWTFMIVSAGFPLWMAAIQFGSAGILLAGSITILLFGLYRQASRSEPSVIEFDGLALRSDAWTPSGRLSTSGHYAFDIEILIRKAGILAVIGVILLFLLPVGVVRAVTGSAFILLGIVHLVRVLGDRTVLSFDSQEVAVRGLLGESRLRWSDVDEIRSRKVLWVVSLFGLSSKCLSIEASPDRSEGPAELLVPIDLLGLDEERLRALVSSLLNCRDNAAYTSPAEASTPEIVHAPFSKTDRIVQVQDGAPPRSFGTRGLNAVDASLADLRASPSPDAWRQSRAFGRRTSLQPASSPDGKWNAGV
jgi:hypothetical protein